MTADSDPKPIYLPRERAEQFGRMVAIQIEAGNWEKAAAVLARARMEAARAPDALGHRDCLPSEPDKVAIAELGIDARTVNSLESGGIFFAAAAIAADDADLRRIANFGDNAHKLVRHVLGEAFSLPAAERTFLDDPELGIPSPIVARLERAGYYRAVAIIAESDDELLDVLRHDRASLDLVRAAVARFQTGEPEGVSPRSESPADRHASNGDVGRHRRKRRVTRVAT